MLVTAAAVSAAALGVCAAPMAGRYRAQRRLRRLCAERSALVLTYDDGPGPESTPRVLDLLRVRGARATFFALGRKAEEHGGLLDRVVREGHEIGCHSYAHLHAWRRPLAAVRDVIRGFEALERWVPRDGLFRPPYGKITPLTWAVARSRHARLAWWTIDSGDTWDALPDPAVIVRRVAADRGGVVLMHDLDRAGDRQGYVLDLTERLLAHAAEATLRVLPMGELLRVARAESAVAWDPSLRSEAG